MFVRKTYEEKAEAEFAAVKARLDALAEQAHQAIAAGKKEAGALLHSAQAKHDEAFHRLTLLKQSGEDGYDAVKASFESAWAEFRSALA